MKSITGTWSCKDGFTYHIYQREELSKAGIYVSLYSEKNGKVMNVGVGSIAGNQLRFVWADTPETGLNYNGTCGCTVESGGNEITKQYHTTDREIGNFKRIS